MKKIINWGMIGTGDVTEKKSGPSFSKVDHSRLVAVTNRTKEKAVSYASRHNIPGVYDSAEELINAREVEAVYIATPPSSHEEYAIMAMMAGKPVYVEKPMADSYSACRTMLSVAGETGTPLFVAYYRRSMEYFLRVKELLDKQMIGRPLLCTSSLVSPPRAEDLDPGTLTWRVRPEISGGGYFHDMGCHELDLFCFLLGPVKNVAGSARNAGGLYTPEDTIVAAIEFESGLLYSGSWCFVAFPGQEKDEIIIFGEKGSIRFSCFSFGPIQLRTHEGSREFPVAAPEHVQQPMIQDVVNELRGKGRSPSHGESGAETSRIMEMILGAS